MQVRCGTTRLVILAGNRAYKIARFRPIRPLIRLFQLMKVGGVRSQLETYGQNLTRGGINYLLAGLLANRVEYQLSKEYPDALISPVVALYLWGVMIIQDRGETVSIADKAVKSHPLWAVMLAEKGSETAACSQFARFVGKVLLVDYGRAELRAYFA